MMMAWERPRIEVEKFIANEYVAACGDSGTTYLFECIAGGGKYGSVWWETNNKENLQTNREYVGDGLGGILDPDNWISADTRLTTTYHACGATHEASTTDDFLNGYYIQDGTNTVTKVIIWRGPDGNNVHCTTNLDKNTWETAKS